MGDLLESFNKIPTPQRILVMLLVVILLSVVFYFLVYQDLEEGIEREITRKQELLTTETDIKRKVAQKEEIMSELGDLKVRKEKVEKVLPRKAEIPSLLQKIYGQAKIVGLEIRSFEPGAEAPQNLYTEIPVAMSLRGSYDQVADFFYYVGRMERIVNIKNITMEREKGGTFGAGILTVSCDAITYRSGGKPPAAPPGAAPAGGGGH
jgi:type IV pilus assembly protein PilO